MARDVAAIIKLLARRQKDTQTSRARMVEFEQYLAGDLEVAVPELDSHERASIANLAAQGLEQMALRAGSTVPDIRCPPLRTRSAGDFKKWEDNARDRRMAQLGWWEHNAIREVNALRFQHIFAHGLMPVTVLPDPASKIPQWTARSPLNTFPAASHNPVDIEPVDCMFVRQETWGWLKDRYGQRVLALKRPRNTEDDDLVQIIEYVDRHEIVWVARCEQKTMGPWPGELVGVDEGVELDRLENKAGCQLAFVPGWVTVIGNRGKFTNTIGAHQMRAKLLSLAYMAAYKGAFPDTWVEPIDNSSTPNIVQHPDPRTGEAGVIEQGRHKSYAPDPGFYTSPMLSILEREIRLEGGIPAELGGEAASNVRTGRRGDQLLSASIDYPIQRAQQIMERSMTCELKAAQAIVKNWTSGPKSFYVNWRNAKGYVDYDPETTFVTDQVTVQYSMAGSDLNAEIIRAGQKVGIGHWSLQTSRERDPETEDAELEKDRVNAERLEGLAWEALGMSVQNGILGPDDLVELDKAIRGDRRELIEAIAQAHEKAQERQAEQQAQAQAGAAQQPGLGTPGLLAGPTDDMSNFRATLGALYPATAQLGGSP
jgi:hypothetical protein